jgi:parallel beta-helix repeat protein
VGGCDRNLISKNDVSNNEEHGIFAYAVAYVAIISNTANNNKMNGISLNMSDGNSIFGNTANGNANGILLNMSDGNFIFDNTANGNVNGTNLLSSNNNIITGNILYGNDYCMNETNSVNNLYTDNYCTTPPALASPFDPFIQGLFIGFVIGLGVLAAVLMLNLMRHRKK